MRIFDRPKIILLSMTSDPLRIMWVGARNCFMGDEVKKMMEKYNENNAKKLVAKIIKMQHDSVLEHCIFTFAIENVSRSLMAQLTRHRHCTFHCQSQHYQNYSDFTYKELEMYPSDDMKKQYYQTMDMINALYKKLISEGCPHYIAREVLPNAAGVKIIMTCNLREARHILELRLPKNNTPEIIEVSKEIYNIIYKICPEFVEDLGEKHGIIKL